MAKPEGKTLVFTIIAIFVAGLILNVMAASMMPKFIRDFAGRITAGYGTGA